MNTDYRDILFALWIKSEAYLDTFFNDFVQTIEEQLA